MLYCNGIFFQIQGRPIGRILLLRACGEVKKAIGETEVEVRKKLDCLVVKVDLVLTRKEFEVMPYFLVFDDAVMGVFNNTSNAIKGFY